MTCSEIWQNFEKFPQIFREIVQKFNIIQYYSIVSLIIITAAGRLGADRGRARGRRRDRGHGRQGLGARGQRPAGTHPTCIIADSGRRPSAAAS